MMHSCASAAKLRGGGPFFFPACSATCCGHSARDSCSSTSVPPRIKVSTLESHLIQELSGRTVSRQTMLLVGEKVDTFTFSYFFAWRLIV
jgi:hypothetical protein